MTGMRGETCKVPEIRPASGNGRIEPAKQYPQPVTEPFDLLFHTEINSIGGRIVEKNQTQEGEAIFIVIRFISEAIGLIVI